MTRADEFLELYKKLEAIVANNYGNRKEGGSVAKLGKRSEFRHIREELDYIRDVRNLLAHRPRISDDYVVEPSEGMIELLKKVIEKVERPAVAESIMVKLDDVISCNKGDFVIPALRKMNEKAIAYIPVLSEGRVCGVFSERAFIQYTVSQNRSVDEGTMFYEIEDVLSFDSSSVVKFLFTDRKTPIDELSDLFDEAAQNDQKIGMIFVTEHGKDTEALLGIITAWDVAAAF